MYFHEALAKAHNGAKIRRKSWDSHCFIKNGTNRRGPCFVNHSNDEAYIKGADIAAHDWEIYEEKEKLKSVKAWFFKDKASCGFAGPYQFKDAHNIHKEYYFAMEIEIPESKEWNFVP